MSIPYLITDIGGTLITRERPGAKRRAIGWLEQLRGALNFYFKQERMTIARAVLTARNPDIAAKRLADAYDLTSSQEEELRVVLSEDEGPAAISQGAPELLQAARKAGWRVVFATNACAWVAPIPRALFESEDIVVSSSTLGILKDDPDFWRILIRSHGVEQAYALVIGDSQNADVSPAHEAGLSAILISSEKGELEALARSVALAGVMPDNATALAAGRIVEWGGDRIIEVRNMTSLVKHTTRKSIRLVTSAGAVRAKIIRRTNRCPAIAPAPGDVGTIFVGWVAELEDRRLRMVSDDLRAALAVAGVELKNLDPRLRRHFISFVEEAKDLSIRKERLASIQQYLEKASKGI